MTWRLQLVAAVFLLATDLIASSGSEPPPVFGVAAAPSKTPLEQFYNPFGDPWEMKRPPKPEVPVSLTPACHRSDPKRSLGAPSAEEIQWVARSNSRLVFEECAELADVSDGKGAALLRPFTAALKAFDPSVKFIAFYTASMLPTGVVSASASVGDGEAIGLRYIDANQESWFVHQKGKPPTRQNRLRHVSSFAEVLDMTNPDLRRYLARELVRSMDFHTVDGVMIDSCHDLPQYNPSIPGNVPPDAVLAGWAQGCIALVDEVKRADPSKLVFALNYWSLVGQTSPNHEEYDFEWFARRLAVADGILWEDPIGLVDYPPAEVQRSMDRLAARIAYARARDKYLGVFVNTNVGNQSTFRTTTVEQQQAYARYYFAAYLTVAEGLRTLLIPYTPIETVDQFNSAAYFTDWDLDVGRATGPRQMLATGVYRRDFERARVFLNGSTGPLDVALEDRTFVTTSGVPVRAATIPPKSGAIFLAAVPSPVCSPRPPVRLRTRVLDAGAVEVQIVAGQGDVHRLEVGRAPHTLLSVQGGPQRVAGDRMLELPRGSRSAVVTLQPASAGGGVFAQINVVDDCGAWKTFAGRGG